MHLNREQREQVRLMFGGKCAYCGEELPRNWHADHFEPVVRYTSCYTGESGQLRPENNRYENFRPACPPCNLAKSSMSIEHWRDMLIRNQKAMIESSKFKLLKKHGLVNFIIKPIKFYFETVGGADA